MKNIAIILAGGNGTRMGEGTPKQFFKVAGQSIIEHTVSAFESNNFIDEIFIVMNPHYMMNVENMVIANEWKKVKKILNGGKERYDSSLAAINACDEECNLIIHDAVRPLVNNRIINDVVSALKKYNAIDVAVPASDTIIQVDESGNFIESIPNRNFLRRGQTPQGFKLSTIKKAYDIALKDKNFISTDDCGVVKKYLPKEKIFVVSGEESNIKLTYKEDIYLLDKLFQLKSMTLNGETNYKELKDKVIVVFGGNSGIGESIINIANKHKAKTFSFSRGTTKTDISNRESVKSALQSVYNKTNRIDYVVNSAAILTREPLVGMDPKLIDSVIRTNYDGMINIAVESYDYLKESKGQLLLFTSSSYNRGRAFYSIYSSTKAAAVNFAQAVSQEWENVKIRVNVINPQRTKTNMRTKNFGKEPDDTLLTADEVGEMSIKTLLSDFTGQVIDVKLKNKEH